MRRRSLCAVGRSEQNAIGHDDRRSPTGLEQLEEQGQEQQFGLLGLDDPLQILGGRLVVQRSGERRVGQDQRVLLGVPAGALGQRVAVADVGDSMPCSSMFMLPMRSMVASKS